ncbi:MAG: hypothetical protein F6K37_25245 [Moorea sp. SIO4E2]|uniref:hypothetical protein n=1 Tax=Moorena sp. SIO4E2 TaxID=2607826 RepID=UPI0013B83DFA|nr:hypothetical protein [Moorena sp. SIO4E2]NEQ09127.1 hypothetical protein [Moorena sp. SIO4E2]
MKLQNLYNKIKNQVNLNLTSELSVGSIRKFYQSCSIDKEFIINITKIVRFPEQENEDIQYFIIRGKTSSFGLDNLEVELLFKQEFNALKSNLKVNFIKNNLLLPGVRESWFYLKDIELTAEVADALVPVKGSVSGTVNILPDLRFSMQLPVVQNKWVLKGSLKPSKGISGLVAFAGGDLSPKIPAFVQAAAALKVEDVGILFDAGSSTVEYISLSVITAKDFKWEVLPEAAITDIMLDATVLNPGNNNRRVIYAISGKFEIGDSPNTASIRIRALAPDYQIIGGLSEGSKIHLKALIQYFFKAADNFPEIDVTKLYLFAYPNQETYNLRLGITDNWKFYLDEASGNKYVELSNVNLNTEKSKAHVKGSIDALFKLAVIDIVVSASHLGLNQGWQFQGSTGSGQEIYIGTLIDDLANKFDKITLPLSISELIIENLGVSFNTKTKDFTFTCESKFPIDGEPVDITVSINITQQKDGSYKKHFEGHITINDLQFALILGASHFGNNITQSNDISRVSAP